MAKNIAENIAEKPLHFYEEYLKPRYYYIERYLSSLEISSNISKKDKNKINIIKKDADIELIAVKKLHIISIILYVAIYFSVINIFLSEIYFIGEYVSVISQIITFVGAPVFVVLQFITIRFRNIRFEKLSLYASHLISYSTKS